MIVTQDWTIRKHLVFDETVRLIIFRIVYINVSSPDVLVNVDCQHDKTKSQSSGMRELWLKNCLNQISLWRQFWDTLLIAHWCKKAQLTVSSASGRQVGWSWIGTSAEQEPVSRLPCGFGFSYHLSSCPAFSWWWAVTFLGLFGQSVLSR